MSERNQHRPTRGTGLTDSFDPVTAQLSHCAGKDAFPSRAAAQAVLRARINRTGRRHHPHKGKRKEVAKIQIYLCDHCQHWHFGIGNRR